MATYDLTIEQGARLQRTFQYLIDGVAQSLAGYSFKAQVRQKEKRDSLLLLDLTSHLALREGDDTRLDLDVPATVTAALQSTRFREESAWDLFLYPTGDPDAAFLLLQGTASIDPSATDMRSA